MERDSRGSEAVRARARGLDAGTRACHTPSRASATSQQRSALPGARGRMRRPSWIVVPCLPSPGRSWPVLRVAPRGPGRPRGRSTHAGLAAVVAVQHEAGQRGALPFPRRQCLASRPAPTQAEPLTAFRGPPRGSGQRPGASGTRRLAETTRADTEVAETGVDVLAAGPRIAGRGVIRIVLEQGRPAGAKQATPNELAGPVLAPHPRVGPPLTVCTAAVYIPSSGAWHAGADERSA
jgi:hypothetical protein